MLIVPLNLPSVPVPVVPPQTASSSPSSTGNTRRDGPYERLNIRTSPLKLGRITTSSSGSAPRASERPILPNAGPQRRDRFLPLCEGLTDQPVMAIRIFHASLSQPVWLIREGKHDGRACGQSTPGHLVGLVDDEAYPHGRAAQRLGAQVERLRVLVNHEECLFLDGHLRDDLS